MLSAEILGAVKVTMSQFSHDSFKDKLSETFDF